MSNQLIWFVRNFIMDSFVNRMKVRNFGAISFKCMMDASVPK